MSLIIPEAPPASTATSDVLNSGSPAVTETPEHRRQRERTARLTTASLGGTVLMLALPVLGEQLLATFVGLFDIFLAGKISMDATAAVGLASYVGWFANMMFMLVATGATALVSRMTGAGQHAEANHVANQSMTSAAIGGLLVAPFLYILAPAFATLQNMSGPTQALVVQFLRIDAVGLGFMGLTLAGGAVLRGVGDMRTPLVILSVVNVLNGVISATLTFGLGPFEPWGVLGIVTGTLIARTLGGLTTLTVLAWGCSGLRLRPAFLAPHSATLRRIFRIGLPAMGNGAIMWTGQFFFLYIIARLASGETGRAYYAAHMIAIRMEAFTYLPAVAWGMATATLVGQALGAGYVDRARRVAHVAVAQCGTVALVVAVWFLLDSEGILLLMQNDPRVAEVGAIPFKVLGFFQPLLVAGIIYVQALQGAGDTRSPLLYSLAGATVIRLPLAYVFGIVLDGGLLGAWVGMYGDMTARAVFGFVRYSRGRWVRTRV